MVSQVPFQSYQTNVCSQCMTGFFGGRWRRYQQSRRNSRKRDILWFSILCAAFLYVTYFFYFWLISKNNFDDIDWYFYRLNKISFAWYRLFLGLASAAFVYYLVLMCLGLCHIVHGHQLYISFIHRAVIIVTFIGCVAVTVFLDKTWRSQWAVVYLSFQMTGPFIYIGIVTIVTLLTWIIAAQWVNLLSRVMKLVSLSVYISLLSCLYVIPVFLHPPCVLNTDELPAKPKIVAHRGAAGIAPENTLASFEYAVTNDAVVIESDVRISQDGVLFLMHDIDLTRTTNVESVFPNRSSQLATSFTYQELMKLDAGSWFIEDNPMGVHISREDRNRFKGLKIMTFSQYLEEAQSNGVSVIFDIFLPPYHHPFHNDTMTRIFDEIRRSKIDPSLVWFLVYDIVDAYMLRTRFNYTFVYGKLESVENLESVGLEIVNIESFTDSQHWIRLYQRANISTVIYTVDTEWLFSLYWCMGSRYVSTNMCHFFREMTAPVWTMRPNVFLATWVTLNCVSVVLIAAIFVLQSIRLARESPATARDSSETVNDTAISETTFQSDRVMKYQLLSADSSNLSTGNESNQDYTSERGESNAAYINDSSQTYTSHSSSTCNNVSNPTCNNESNRAYISTQVSNSH